MTVDSKSFRVRHLRPPRNRTHSESNCSVHLWLEQGRAPQWTVPNECPRAPRQQPPPERDPPDIQDVLTQQTEVHAGMLAELRARQAPAAAAVNAAEPPEDLDFDWTRLVQPPETSFQVPGNGQVQRMAASLLTRLPTMAGRDQHEARFVLQVVSLWPDLQDEERFWVFQRLYVYCIVAALGWPQATAACASTSASTDYI